MAPDRLLKMIDATFTYFASLAKFYQDPPGLDAVREVRDQMARDLAKFTEEPSRAELVELCRQWRAQRIEIGREASYPPDEFIESVCQVFELS